VSQLFGQPSTVESLERTKTNRDWQLAAACAGASLRYPLAAAMYWLAHFVGYRTRQMKKGRQGRASSADDLASSSCFQVVMIHMKHVTRDYLIKQLVKRMTPHLGKHLNLFLCLPFSRSSADATLFSFSLPLPCHHSHPFPPTPHDRPFQPYPPFSLTLTQSPWSLPLPRSNGSPSEISTSSLNTDPTSSRTRCASSSASSTTRPAPRSRSWMLVIAVL
jgi:hypothetical protein